MTTKVKQLEPIFVLDCDTIRINKFNLEFISNSEHNDEIFKELKEAVEIYQNHDNYSLNIDISTMNLLEYFQLYLKSALKPIMELDEGLFKEECKKTDVFNNMMGKISIIDGITFKNFKNFSVNIGC